jgi:uncharacterized protein YgiM (DUF1202 family)
MRRYLLLLAALFLLASCDDALASPTRTPAVLPNITISTATPQSPTPVPAIQPTPAAAVRCPAAPPVRLIVLERGKVTENNQRLNLRSGPGVEYNSLALLPEGAVFFVLDGPACSGGFTWFRVSYRGRVGWLAEGDSTQYYVEPYFPG